MSVRTSSAIVAGLVLACSVAARASVFAEAGDAGATPTSAQATAGGAPLTQITGAISSSADADFYKITSPRPRHSRRAP